MRPQTRSILKLLHYVDHFLNFLGAKGGGLRARLPLSRLMQTAGFASKGDVLFSSGEKSLVPSTIARGRR